MKKILLGLTVLLLLTACSTGKGSGNVDVKEVHAKVKEAYGENYVPKMPVEMDLLETLFNVSGDDIASFVAELPMMNVHIDTFIAIEAKPGKADSVKKALETYRDEVVNNGFNYPMNIAKAQASQVIQHGDYVFFVMLGAFDDSEYTDEATALKFAKDQTQIGIDAINSFFK